MEVSKFPSGAAVPHGCYGRIGAEYELYHERWRLHRVNADEREPYVFRSVGRRSAYTTLTGRRFLKVTSKAARKLGTTPCFQCRVPITSERAVTVHCDECRPAPRPRQAIPPAPVVVAAPPPTPTTPEPKGQLSLF